MNINEYRKHAADMIYLTACALQEKTPDASRIAEMDPEQVFALCQEHILTGCAAYALEAAGVRDPRFTQAKEKAVRKSILLRTECSKVTGLLEQEQIWHMPLKGALLAGWYPRAGMRQMSDIDILCDPARRKDIVQIMASRGFRLDHESPNVDAYQKPPVYHIEIHERFFNEYPRFGGAVSFYDYYRDVKPRLVRDAGTEYGYHFTDEDYYIYLMTHAYKHYARAGTGVRTLIDFYVFNRKFGETLNRAYVDAELEKLGLTDFERQGRTLACKLMEEAPLTDAEQAMLDYYVTSGTYGTVSHAVGNRLQNQAKGSPLRYMMQRLFPPMELYRIGYPWAYRHRILLPAAWVYRILRGLTSGRERTAAELRVLRKK